MLSEQVFIDRFLTTGYEVNLALGPTVLNDLILSTPKIQIGFLGMQPKNPQLIYSDGYADYEHPVILHINLDIIFKRTDIVAVLTAIRNKYLNWYPGTAGNSNYSSCIFIEGSVRAVSYENMHWNEIIGVILPRVI